MEQLLSYSIQKLENPWRDGTYAEENEKLVPRAVNTIYCSAQPVLDKEGRLFSGLMADQITEAFDLLETTLHNQRYAPADVTSIRFYSTNAEAFYEAYGGVLERLKKFSNVPYTTIKEVKMLSFPSLLFELEAFAAK